MAGNALYDVGLRLRAAELHDMGRVPSIVLRKFSQPSA